MHSDSAILGIRVQRESVSCTNQRLRNIPLQYKQLGRYEIVERIGRGAMAEVFKARQPTLDRFVAIKILHPHLADDEEFKIRFGREAQNVARLRHNNIVQVYDFDKADVDNDTLYFMVMELIEGPTLKDYISQAPHGMLSLEESLSIMRQAMLALAYAHGQGMIHRDLKPANLMLDRDGRVVMADFGIAKILTGNQFTASGGMIGTPAYMAPEAGLGTMTDERSDLYSMGVILFQMLTGRLPFDADTPVATILKHVNENIPPIRSLNPKLPLAVEQVVNRALAKDPDERYQTALDLLGAVEALQTALGKPPTPIGPVIVTRPPNAKAGPETLVIPPETSSETIRLPEAPTKFAPRLPSTSSAEPPSLRTGIPKTSSQQMKTPFPTPPTPVVEAPVRRAGLGCVLIGALVIVASVIGGLLIAGLITGQVPLIGVILRPSETAIQPAFVPITATTPALIETAISAAPTTPPPTATFTQTATPSATPTFTQTATPSPTPSFTATPSPTATFTASPTETATITPTPSSTATPTANFTATIEAATQVAANATATIAQATIVAFFETQRALTSPTPDYTATARVCKNEYEFIAPLAPTPAAPRDPIRANTRFEREVILRNIGDCDWLPGASLNYLDGERFNAPRRVEMVNADPVRPGGEARFVLSGTTPSRGGVYTGRWEFRLAGGVLVEPVVAISFFVFQ